MFVSARMLFYQRTLYLSNFASKSIKNNHGMIIESSEVLDKIIKVIYSQLHALCAMQ